MGTRCAVPPGPASHPDLVSRSMSSLLPQTSASSPSSTDALRDYVGGLVRAPLAAVRAALETLEREENSSSRRQILRNILCELTRIDCATEVLVDQCAPGALHRDRCSIDELVQASLERLDPPQRARVRSALDQPALRVTVDGPLLSRSLGIILASAFRQGASEVFLHSHVDGQSLWFTIADDLEAGGQNGIDPSRASGMHSGGNSEIQLAAGELRRLGGSLDVNWNDGRHACVIVGLPLEAGDAEVESA